jgi:hypothetical protein
MLAAVKQIHLFRLYNTVLQSFITVQQGEAMDDMYLALGDKAKIVNLKIR